MISREQIKDATLRRLKYEIKVCTEHNNPKAEDYQEQIDNIDLYVDENIAKLANLIIERVHYLPIESIIEKDGEKFVLKIINIKNNVGYVDIKKIKTGKIDKGYVEILEGVNLKDFIIKNNVFSYSQNQKVKL